MQLVRTAQPKHKINLLSLSTEAGGPDVGHLVCSINSMQFVRTAQFKHKHLLALYSHSPRRTGGPQAPASGALVLYITVNVTRGYTLVKTRHSRVPTYLQRETATADWSTPTFTLPCPKNGGVYPATSTFLQNCTPIFRNVP